MEEPAFSRVLDAIYDASASADCWSVALERVADMLGATTISLIDRNPNTMEGRAISRGVDAAGQREYFDHWTKHDIIRQRTRAFRAGAVERDQDILPRAELLRSDYYNGFMKPRDHGPFLRLTLLVEPSFRKFISINRPIACAEFDTHDIEMSRRLMPHLQRAALVTRRIDESKVLVSSFSDLLEQSATGVVMLNQDGLVMFANRAVLDMADARDGFTIRAKRIEAIAPDSNTALQRLIAAATGRFDRADAPRGGAVSLRRALGKTDYAVTAAPLPRRSLLERGPIAFLLITDPQATSARSTSVMSQLFGLSAAEMRLVARLMLGESPEEAAAALNIKVSTARWHLSSLYRKTGTRRQAQLVRLLMSLPNI